MAQIVRNLIPEGDPQPELQRHRHPANKEEKKRQAGVLLRINQEKGYGFIRPDSGGAEYFVHVGSMIDREAWVEGQRVTFVPGKINPEKKKAPPAFAVRAIRTPEA